MWNPALQSEDRRRRLGTLWRRGRGCVDMEERVSRKQWEKFVWISLPNWAIASKIMARAKMATDAHMPPYGGM